MTSRTRPFFFWIVFLCLGVGHSLYAPLWSAPDEELHYAYCQYVSRTGTLPRIEPPGTDGRVSMAFHPPLYYLAGSLFCGSGDTPVLDLVTIDDSPGFGRVRHLAHEQVVARSALLLRLCTLLLCSSIFWFVFLTAQALFPRRDHLAVLAAVLAVANPQFMHVAGSISNEGPAAALATLYILLLVRYAVLSAGSGTVVGLGAVLGVCLLAKTSAVFLLPLTGIILLVKRLCTPGRLCVESVTVFSVAAVLSGWWYAANWTMLRSLQTSQPWFTRFGPLTPGYAFDGLTATFKSFFGWFGALEVPLPGFSYLLYAIVFGLGGVGFVRLLLSRALRGRQLQGFAVLGLALAGAAGVFLLLNRQYYAFQGKYLFVAMGPIAVFVAAGLVGFFLRTSENAVTTTLSLGLCALCGCSLFSVLRPACAAPRITACVSQPVFSSTRPPDGNTAMRSATQSFVVPADNLCGVRVVLTRRGEGAVAGSVVFELFEQGVGGNSLVCRAKIAADEVMDAHYYYFSFPPQPGSRGHGYALVMTFPATPDGVLVYPWHDSSSVYPDGAVLVDETTEDGDLLFDAFCFIGNTRPASVWEGCRSGVYEQGMYISIREMQLLDACGPGRAPPPVLAAKVAQVYQVAAEENPPEAVQ